ncbi:hypothetical protein DVH24_006073 [Malus domestica]|uniref:Uncharacterized protein n=1 Tax=Malus domestica TaxID=3750 RepID=A0A498J364_MALDO|nr:hypothetical protein DVH24_006073 [Malus domestica]
MTYKKQATIPIYLDFRGLHYISNFYLDWVSMDFRVRMGKDTRVLIFLLPCSFACVLPLCIENSKQRGEEIKQWNETLTAMKLSIISCRHPRQRPLFYLVVGHTNFAVPSSLKTSIDSWLQSLA